MAETKNILMRQYNGTDYDTLYPKTLSSLIDGSWDLSKVTGVLGIKNGGTGGMSLDNIGRVQYIEYVGNGSATVPVDLTLTFDFVPVAVFLSIRSPSTDAPLPENMDAVVLQGQTKQYVYTGSGVITRNLTWSGKTLIVHSTSAGYMFNNTGTGYLCVAIGSDSVTEYSSRLITESGTFVVPETAEYYIELHGGGGASAVSAASGCGGGGSGQSYTATLTAGTSINVTIGDGGVVNSSSNGSGGSTTFGNYSVAGGGGASAVSGGVASGNLATAGSAAVNSKASGGGYVGQEYGAGGYWDYYLYAGESYAMPHNGGSGAVYLRWISTSDS